MRQSEMRGGKVLRKRSSKRRLRFESLEPRLCLSLSVPALSSLPGANHTIYLDFDGSVTSGTTWNSGYYGEDPIVSPAWSLDSDRANFSQTELDTIVRVWGRVAEDFSPFNINVTTVEPPINDLRRGEVGGDTKWGVRAVVTIENTTLVHCGCGGIAYIGSFNDSQDEPVFIYNSSESGVAEAISHEVGHSLYLAHDGLVGADGIPRTADDVEYYAGHGSGATTWAPIMGSSYNRNVTTWDQGEYYKTNNGTSSANYNNGPDDLNVIATRNGFGYRPDDHENGVATATPLSIVGTTASGSGIIGNRTDVDVFSFTTGAGAVTLNINPVDIRPNLDIQADLLDSSGNLISSSNPAAALNATISATLAAGLYYLRIDGVGFGDPTISTPTGYTDYDSIGQFSISGTIVDSGALPTISIDDVTVSEAAGEALFAIHLNGSISADATVSYTTVNGSATAGTDYATNSGTLTFTPGGPTTITVPVPVSNDSAAEAVESFSLVLSAPSSNVLIADSTGVATITNDDAAFLINNTSVTEGNVNRKGVISYSTATFTVSLQQPVDHPVDFSYATGAPGDTATPNVDYISASGTKTISTGQSSASLMVTVIGDNAAESNETFVVIINGGEAVGTGTILDNDSGGKGGGKGGGNGGGGKPPKSADEAAEDFTIIDHTDLAEPMSGATELSGHSHTQDHSHSDSETTVSTSAINSALLNGTAFSMLAFSPVFVGRAALQQPSKLTGLEPSEVWSIEEVFGREGHDDYLFPATTRSHKSLNHVSDQSNAHLTYDDLRAESVDDALANVEWWTT